MINEVRCAALMKAASYRALEEIFIDWGGGAPKTWIFAGKSVKSDFFYVFF